jgi:hypothetical protein
MFDMKYNDGLLHPDWPDIRWNITGLINYRLFVGLLTYMMKNQNISHVIGSFHGCPDLMWNGGRVNTKIPDYPDIAGYFKTLNKLGIGVYLTFSNIVLEEKHLADEPSNRMLDCLDESCGLNGVIVVNDLMSDYIRKKKPGLKQTCSIVKSFIENPQGDLDWYREMEKRFDRVVVHTDHMFDAKLLDGLDRDKAEILITEECKFRCPNRIKHQTMNSEFNIARAEGDPKADEIFEAIGSLKKASCAGGSGILNAQKNPRNVRNCYLAHNEVKAIYDMGFRQFKISGRRRTIYGIAWNVINFVFNPDLAPTVARMLYNRVDKKVKEEYVELAQKKGVSQQPVS